MVAFGTMPPTIEFAANGKQARGHLATPAADKANGKGILVLQEYWGLVPHIKDVADRFAQQGYVALAPDLWDGQVAGTPDEAMRLFMALQIDEAEKQIRGAIAALHEHGARGKVGVIGFCLGGQLALYAGACNPEQIGAVVDFYGIHPRVKPDFSRLRAPVLGIFADQDEHVPPQAARDLEAAVKAAGGRIEIVSYPADHAFFNDTRPVYSAVHAADAWRRTLAFLATNL